MNKMHSFLGHMKFTVRGELKGEFTQTKCGYKSQMRGNVTKFDSKVTCKRCLKIILANKPCPLCGKTKSTGCQCLKIMEQSNVK
jgi:hypothetical protein